MSTMPAKNFRLVSEVTQLCEKLRILTLERDAARAERDAIRRERDRCQEDLNHTAIERDAARAVVEAARNAWSNCDPASKAFQILDQAIRKHDGTESHSIDRFLVAAKGGESK